MTSKKTAHDKRAHPPRKSDCTASFYKDWERLSRSGRYDMRKLKEVMLQLIANEAPLPAERSDHQLSGKMARYRECHIGGDLLLMYLLDNTPSPAGSITFIRTGSHNDLFNE
ncbi:MAG: type II toxin-antitoxin system YafQ family toxin [Magnetococcales bacterium]|nr:type II toxin-antitoxin system YafQ family toxin [Magnetococcales bacterium]